MKTPADFKNNSKLPSRLAIAISSALAASVCHAGPTGGTVVDGGGAITQSGSNTRIDQSTERLSLQWDTFNVAADERVQFVQPSSTSTALNRILDHDGSRILGSIDANGHVILTNPNGIFFGQNAKVNVGGLVASGLNVNSEDYMNGDLAFSALEGSKGTVVNRGLINAATGGNVLLLGKSVANHGLISAELGHIALASGSEAVVTFDDQGLIGVRIDKETLASEVGASAVNNTGTLAANGGKILLSGSVSEDLFSAAVNRGNMPTQTNAVVHNDGSFTLGAGHKVVNTGTLDVSTGADSDRDAGVVVMAANELVQRGTVRANAVADNNAGQVYAEAWEQVDLGAYSRIEANNSANASGRVSFKADNIIAASGAQVATTGSALFSSYIDTQLPTLLAHHLHVQSIDAVSQTGAATVSGNLHLDITGNADVQLSHSDNDFGSFSLSSSYTTVTHIHDKNDLILNDLFIGDSDLHIELSGAGATLSQSADSHIKVSYSGLSVDADNINFGANGSTTYVDHGLFNATFGQSISTGDSVSMSAETGFATSTVSFTGIADGSTALELSSSSEVSLDAQLDGDAYTLSIAGIIGDNASLQGLFETTQTGPIKLNGALQWDSYYAKLDHAQNDIASIGGSGALAFGELTYVDSNDVTIDQLRAATENSVNIRSLGSSSAISQAPNSTLKADFITLNAANIYLGAGGTSEVDAGYVLDIDFSRQLNINGPYSVGSYAPTFRITGDSGNNRLAFGRYATSNSFASDGLLANISFDLGAGNDTAVFENDFLVGDDEYWGSNGLNMGAGDDFVFIDRSDVHLPVTLGSGGDLILIRGAASQYDFTDYDNAEDRFYHIN